MPIGTFILIITLNASGLNASTKKNNTLAEWIQKQDPHKHCVQETHTQTESEGMKKGIP